MRFLHTSDWHLGRLFHNVHLTEDQAYVLQQFVQVVEESKVDVVVIAGDVYDRAVPPAAAVQLLDEVLAQLVERLKVPTVVIAGNHDSPERLGFGARLLRARGLHLYGPLDEQLGALTLHDAHGPVHFVPVPFAVPEAVRLWAEDEGVQGAEMAMRACISRLCQSLPVAERRVAVAHAFVVGGQESDSERSLSVGGSGQVSRQCFEPFQYTALGHLHRPQSVGVETIRYSGSLMKYSFSEVDHRKSISIVEMDGQGAVRVEEVALTPRRDVRQVAGSLQEVLRAAESDSQREDYLLVSLTDREPLLNPMAKLRRVYSNVLHIERPHFGAATATGLSSAQQRKMTPVDLFAAFWRQSRDEPLGDGRLEVLRKALRAGLEAGEQ